MLSNFGPPDHPSEKIIPFSFIISGLNIIPINGIVSILPISSKYIFKKIYGESSVAPKTRFLEEIYLPGYITPSLIIFIKFL